MAYILSRPQCVKRNINKLQVLCTPLTSTIWANIWTFGQINIYLASFEKDKQIYSLESVIKQLISQLPNWTATQFQPGQIRAVRGVWDMACNWLASLFVIGWSKSRGGGGGYSLCEGDG